MKRMSSRLAAAGATALTGAAVALSLGSPATAAGTGYVALGDSYSSGTGTRTYISDGTSCQRSVYAYPSLDAAPLALSLTFRACSGATVADVTNTQLSALTSTTAYVTISVGGNDAGFASVLTTCAQPSWLSNCNGAIDKAQLVINTTLPGRLTTLYSSIKAKAPNARVIVVGYPRIFNGEDCNLLTWFSPTEESRLNATADLLNAGRRPQPPRPASVRQPDVPLHRARGVRRRRVAQRPVEPGRRELPPQQAGHRDGYAVVTKPAFGLTTTLSAAATTAKAERSAAEARPGRPAVCRRRPHDHAGALRGSRPHDRSRQGGRGPGRGRPVEPGEHRRRRPALRRPARLAARG